MNISDIRSALKVEQGNLTITPATLNSSGVSTLITTVYNDQAIVIQDAKAGPGNGNTAVVFTGAANFLQVEMSVTATFTVGADGSAQAVFDYGPPAGWSFSQSFPNLPNSVDFSVNGSTPSASFLDRLLSYQALTAPRFVATSADCPDETTQTTLAAGLNFIGSLTLAKIPGMLPKLLTDQTAVVTGPVVFADASAAWPVVPQGVPPGESDQSIPGLNLKADLATNFHFLAMGLHNSHLRLYSPLDAAWLTEQPDYAPAIAWVGDLTLGEQMVPALIGVAAPLGASTLIFYLNPQDWSVANLADIGGLFEANDPGSLLPSDLVALIAEKLSALSLENFLLAIIADASGYAWDYAAVTIGLPDVNWQVVPQYVQLNSLAATFTFLAQEGGEPPAVQITLNSQLTIGPVPLALTAQIPGASFSASLPAGQTVSLGDVLQQYLPGVTPPGSLTINTLNLTGTFAPEKSFAIQAGISDVLHIAVANKTFGINDLYFMFGYSSVGVAAALKGVVEICDTQFFLSAAHPTGDAGWEFSGGLAHDQTLNLVAIADALLPQNIQIPQDWLHLAVSKLAVSWNTKTGSFTFQGELDLSLTLVEKHVSAAVTLQIVSTLENGKRQTIGSLSGSLALGDVTFTLTYAFQRQMQKLSAVWQDDADHLQFTDLAAAFGCSLPTPDIQLPDMGLVRAEFDLDLDEMAGDTFIVLAESSTFGDAFLLLIKDPTSGWEAVFGVDIPKAVKPSQLPVLGKQLKFVNFLQIDSAFLLVTSTAIPHFRTPILPALKRFDVPLVPGATLGAVLDIAGSSTSSDVARNIQKLLNVDALLVNATLSDNPANVALTVELGKLSLFNSNYQLQDAKFVIRLDPPSLMVRGTIIFHLGQTSLLATGGLSMGEEVEALFNIAQSGPKLLPMPMGLKGVQLTDIGVMMGVNLVLEEVNFGLEGKFLIGKQKAPVTGGATTTAGLPGTNEFIIKFGFDEFGIPDPNLLLLYLEEIDLDILAQAVLGQNVLPAGLQQAFDSFKVTELLIYWCETPEPLPDGTFAYPLFGFNGNLQILNFWAHAGLKIDYSGTMPVITGAASMSPVAITYQKKPIVKLTGSGTATPDGYTFTDKAVAAGGPFIQVSTAASPYLYASIGVQIFGTVFEAKVNAQISSAGFVFTVQNSLGSAFSSDFDCQLSDWTHFQMSFQVKLDVDVNFSPLMSVDLGTIHLDSDCDVSLTVNVTAAFQLALSGRFDCEGDNYEIPTWYVDVPFASLEQIPAVIFSQIKHEAGTIFKDAIDEAESFLEKYGHDIESFGEKIVHGLTSIFVHRHQENVPPWMRDGHLIKGSGVNVYRMHGLKRRLIPDVKTLQCIGKSANPPIQQIQDFILNTVKVKEPPFPSRADNVLLRARDGQKVYLMQNCQRRHIVDALTFDVNGYRWADVQVIAGDDLSDIPEGKPIKSGLEDGSLIKGSGTAIYLIQKNQKRHVPDPATLNCIRDKSQPVQTLSDNAVNAIPTGPALPSRANNVLLRARGTQKVYVMINCKRCRVVDTLTFEVNGYRWEDVRDIASADLSAIPDGPAQKSGVKEGSLVKGSGVDIYLIENNQKRHIPDPITLTCMGLQSHPVLSFSDGALNAIPTGAALPSRVNGTLLRAAGQAEVYVMENCKRRYIPDPVTLELNGYEWEAIKVVAFEDLKKIPNGSKLDSLVRDGLLLKSSSSTAFYVVKNNRRRHIPNPTTFTCMQFQGSEMQTVSDNTLNAIQLGTPLPSLVDNTLLQARNHDTIFVMLNCQRHEIRKDDLAPNGFNPASLNFIDHDDLTKIPEGSKFVSRSIFEGAIVKGSPPEVYLIQGGKRRHIPDPPTLQCLHELGYGNIRQIPDNEIKRVDKGKPLPSRANNTLLRAKNQDEVFVMQDCKRKFVGSKKNIKDYGYKKGDIKEIDPGDLNAIPVDEL